MSGSNEYEPIAPPIGVDPELVAALHARAAVVAGDEVRPLAVNLVQGGIYIPGDAIIDALSHTPGSLSTKGIRIRWHEPSIVTPPVMTAAGPTKPATPDQLQFAGGDITVHPDEAIVRVNNVPIELTYTEMNILSYLARMPGVFAQSREIITAADTISKHPKIVSQHISRIRHKLGDPYSRTRGGAIESRQDFGYRVIAGKIIDLASR